MSRSASCQYVSNQGLTNKMGERHFRESQNWFCSSDPIDSARVMRESGPKPPGMPMPNAIDKYNADAVR